MDIKHRFQRSFKLRFAIIYPFGFYFLLFSTINEASLRAGIGYIIAGLLIRLWSNGYAIKNDRLTVSGPYAYVRNPLYVGTFLTAFGFVFLLNMGWIVGPLFLLALAGAYYVTIKNEEKMLLEKFGKSYENYRSKVPAMIPRLTPFEEKKKWPFDLQRLVRSKEYKSILWMTIVIIAFHLKTRLLVEHKPMTEKTWGLVLFIALLIIIDVFYELNKKKSK